MSKGSKEPKRPDVKTEDLVYDYYEMLMSPPKIGEKYGITASSIKHRLKKAGYILRDCSKAQLLVEKENFDYLPMDEIVDKYANKLMSIKDIGKEYDVCGNTIRKKLVDSGVRIRVKGELRKGKLIYVDGKRLCELIPPKEKIFDIKKEDLEYKYIDLKMSIKKIAKDYGCGTTTITERMVLFDIPRRKNGWKLNRRKKESITTKEKIIRSPEYHQLPVGEAEEGREIDGRLIGRGGAYTWHYCQDCGKGRWVESRWLRESVYKGKCLPCIQLSKEFRDNLSEGMFTRYADPAEREKTARNSERMWASDPLRKEKHAEFLREVALRPEVSKKKSEYARQYWDDPEWGEHRREKNGQRLGKISKRLWENPEYRQMHIDKSKEMYATPEGKDKQVKAMRQGAQIKPTKPEMQVEKILHDLFPNQWKYVGDGEIIFGGKNPDFVNIKGKKQIIEMFGTYYHSKAHNGKCPLLHMLERKDGYAKFGQDTLIIWQHELEDERAVRGKVLEFCNTEHAKRV